MSVVDWVDVLYLLYAAGVLLFMAYFTRKLTKPKPGPR